MSAVAGRSRSRGTQGPRVVSLVPSSTETLLALGAQVVACTRFCEQPGLPHVGGTKNPDIGAIIDLAPDLVVLDREENRLDDVERLTEAGLDLFVSDVRSVSDAAQVVADLAERVGRPALAFHVGPPSQSSTSSVFVPIWRRPWMSINSATYGASLLAHLGVGLTTDDSDAQRIRWWNSPTSAPGVRRRCLCRASRTCSRIATSPNSTVSWGAAAIDRCPSCGSTGRICSGGAVERRAPSSASAPCSPASAWSCRRRSLIADRCEFSRVGALCNTRRHGTHHASERDRDRIRHVRRSVGPRPASRHGLHGRDDQLARGVRRGPRRRGPLRHPLRQSRRGLSGKSTVRPPGSRCSPPPSAARIRRRCPTPCRTWPWTPSACSTISASTRRTSSARRWAG